MYCSMGSELIRFVEVINSCVSANYHDKYSEAKSNIANIIKYFEDERQRTDIDAAFTVLFDKKNGILQFIQKVLKEDAFSDAIKESFVLLKVLIDAFKGRISHHVVQIKDLCKNCILLEKKAEEKDKAFDVIQSVLENGPWNDNLDVNELFSKLIDPFKSNRSKKLPAKVIQKHLHILGIIVHKYPECLKPEETNLLLRIYLDQLKEQTSLATVVKYQIIAGCLSGLTEFLYIFPLDPQGEFGQRIYDYMTVVAKKHKEMNVAPRSALGLIQAHGGQLAKFLYDNYKFWHEFLLKWVNSAGKDHKAGVQALDAFYTHIVSILKDKTPETGDSVFLYFIAFFNKMFNKGTRSTDAKLAIKAFGLFAAVCRRYKGSQDVVHMFTSVKQRAEQIYFKEEDLSDDELQNLPEYIESLSSIMSQLETVNGEELAALQHLTVLLIENFTKLPKPFHWLPIRAITVAMCNLEESGGTLLDDFLLNIVYQGVIRSCKHQIAVDVELQKDQLPKSAITYRDYVPLWKALLNVNNFKNRCASLKQTHFIVNKLYDELIKTVLVLMKKLDLRIRKKKSGGDGEVDVPVLDPESGLEANNYKDFQVFINLVDLMKDIFMNVDCIQFEKWIQPFCYQVISESSRQPLISGFYKLLTVALQLCEQLDYFNDYEKVQNLPAEQRGCYILLCGFLQELLIRVQQYKNDLQVACLETIIAAPVGLVVPLVPQAAPAFVVLLRMGRSMLPLARLGLSALDKWYRTLPSHLMNPLVIQVVPHLDPFLRSKGMGSEQNAVIEMELMALGRRNRTNYSKHKGVPRNKIVERLDPELSQLQNQIIIFLGQLDSITCLELLKVPQQEEDSIPWAKCLQQPLLFYVPFKDMKLNINLEKLVPRVVELALTSSDRSTRFTACELLHAVVMFMLGCSHSALTSDPDKYSELFRKLSLPLLKLGCDPDPAIHGLYKLLVLQLVHWYSSKFKLKSKEAAILIQTLMDGITHPTDTALRDFSARCLYEFVDWSVKQDSHVNVKAIMRQIFSLSLHPSPSKRLGAALVLNSVYTVLRKEESVVSEFWLELLYHMVINLSLSEETDSVLGSQEQVVTALNHIGRVLKEKASLFNKECNRRRKPTEFEGILLKDAVSWLLVKCGTVQAQCRHKCMELVYELAQLLPDCKTGSQFVSWYAATHSWTSLVKICEGSKESGGIAYTPTLKHLRNEVSLVHVVRWLRMLLTSLECYVWLFNDKGQVKPSVLLGADLDNMSEARIFEAVIYFIQNVSHHDADSVTRCLSNIDEDNALATTPWEAESFNRIKCSVTVRVFDMISAVLKSEPCCLTDSLLNVQLWQLIVDCVLRPDCLGFDMYATEVLDGLPKNLIELLGILQQKLPTKMAELNMELKISVSSLLTDVFKNVQDCLRSNSVTLEQKQLLQGLEILHRCQMLSQIVQELPDQSGLDGNRIVKDLFVALAEGQGDTKKAVFLQPAAISFAESLLKFAFSLNKEVTTVVCCLKEQSSIHNPSTHSSVGHGEHFFVTFRSAILEHMLECSEQSVDCLARDISENNVQFFIRVVTELLQYCAKNRSKYGEGDVVYYLQTSIEKHWNRLCSLVEGNAEKIYQLLGLVVYLARIMPQPIGGLVKYEAIHKWVITQLTSHDLQLHYKSRALDLLMCLTGPQEDDNEQLRSALQKMRDQNFPQQSTEFHSGSPEYSTFVSAFRKILRGLEDSGSCVLLIIVVAMAAGESKHVCEDRIQRSLKTFIERLDNQRQVKAIEAVFKVFLDQDYHPSLRLGCAQRFVRPLLQGCGRSSARDFYKCHIQDLQNTLHATLDRRNQIQAEHQLVGRVGAWSILEPLFVQLETDELESMKCVETGKKLITDLTSRAYNYRIETLPDDLVGNAQLVELFRQSQCAAFNTLVAIISIKSELKFFTCFLFSENKAKEVPWDKLVDCKKKYALKLDWEEIPTLRKHLVSIRWQAQAQRRETEVHYIPSTSHYLFDSTLNEDVTLFDFTTSLVHTHALPGSDGKTCMEQSGAESTEVQLESDDLNIHECMAALCGVINHMVEKGISPAPEQESKDAALPPWMESIQKCLTDSKQPRNVRLFLLKLILNVESKFRPYAHHWVNPVLKAVSDEVVGKAPNYLLSDTVAMLADWCSKVTSLPGTTNRDLLSQLLCLLISNVQHSRRDVFRHNLELIRTVVELWKPNFDIPYQQLYDMITKRDKKDPTVSEPGIQVAAIILANRLEPWSSTGKRQFLPAVLRNIDSEKRSVYQSSAVVAGMALELLHSNGSGMLEDYDAEFSSQLTEKLNSIKDTAKDKFLTCLFAVQEHYPLIVDNNFMNYVLFHLPKTYGIFRVMCLKIVYSRLEILGDDVYAKMKSIDLLKALSDRDPDQQNLALNIVLKMVSNLKSEQYQELIHEVCKFETHRSVECREVMYEILKWIYDHCQDIGGELIEETKETLLKGLSDDNPRLQNLIFEYWNSNAQQQDATTSERLLFTLTDLYCPATESNFLSYSTQYLLESTVGTPDYKQNIFKEPLQKCRFGDFRMLLSWRAQRATVAPMFANTLASQLIQSQSLSSDRAGPLLRATQASLAFQPTIEQSGSSLGSLPSLSTSSSLLFTVGSFGEKQRKSYKMEPGFGSNRLQPKPEASDEVDSGFPRPVSNLRRRFLRHSNQNRIFHAKREIQRSDRKQELQEERSRRLEANIASYREYRSGDFPDIEIPYSAIIKLLQVLAKRDAAVARQLFVLLFDGLLKELLDDKEMYTQKVQKAMRNILNTTKYYTAMVMGTVMEIALHHGEYIVLPVEDIATASQGSGLLSLGCLLLEETIVLRDPFIEAGPSKRSKTLEPSPEEDLWVKLAEMYERMDEWDVVRGIYHKHLDCGENIHKALQWETSGHWFEAEGEYAAALSSGQDTFTDYCIVQRYKCFARLSKWEELREEVSRQVGGNLDQLLTDKWFQENLLPFTLLSEIQIMMDKGADHGKEQQFLQQVDGWLVDKDKHDLLSNQYCEELAAIYVIQDKAALAKHQVEHCITMFLDRWTELNPLSNKLRAKYLLDLQKTAELQACLAFATADEESECVSLAGNLVKRWRRSLPSAFDSLLCWDIRTMYRKKFTSKIDEILKNTHASNSLSHLELAMVDVAICQENYDVAARYLLQTKKKLSNSYTDMQLRYKLACSRAQWLKVQRTNVPNEKMQLSLKSWNVIDSCAEDQRSLQHPLLYVETLQHVSVMAAGILQQLTEQPDVLTKLNTAEVKKLADRIGASDCRQDTLKHHLKQHGLRSLKKAAELVTPACNQEKAVAKAYLEIAKYCRAHSDTTQEEDRFTSEVVTSILRAMRYGSKDARQLFPCLLQLRGLTHLSELFHKESSEVPVWMFLGWVNQLLASLDTSVGPLLHRLVLRLAETYPQALIYAFQLSREKYNLGSGHTSLKDLIDKLDKLLTADPVIDIFLKAFSCLGQPRKMLLYFVEKLEALLNVENPNCDSLCHMYNTMMRTLFPECKENIQGAVFKDIKEYREQLEKAEEGVKSGNKEVIKDVRKIKKKVTEDLEKSRRLHRDHVTPKQLKDYSPWLSDFQAGKYGSLDLEIPGQYTGDSKPLTQYHVKIVGFEQTVEPICSLRCPLLLTIFGSDAREHKYLVKFGEDLRQDQRIEQLFNLMNKILDNDPTCRHRSLSIATYQVVPLSSHHGIIQWVDDTKVLKNLMLDVLDEHEEKLYKKTYTEYDNWICMPASKREPPGVMYGEAYMKYSPEETSAQFRKIVNMVPWDILRCAFQRLSTSPESYFTLRQRFACSYAVLCIAHWLLGIGDRHLSNTLVSVKDGQCVGIDFGHAFGVATQFSPVPELMPFRLTPHIINLLQPLDEAGFFRETMVHCLRALRTNHDMLLATMEVFVQEPSIDWLEFACKDERLNKNLHEESHTWYPQQKIDLAKLKLEGANPVTITTKELTAGLKNSKYLAKYLDCVKGHNSTRANMRPDHLSPEQQVDCLLDQATDYNILGKTWEGWEPWM